MAAEIERLALSRDTCSAQSDKPRRSEYNRTRISRRGPAATNSSGNDGRAPVASFGDSPAEQGKQRP